MNKIIRGILLIAVLCIGIFVGFTLLQDGGITGADVVCTFNDEICECNEEQCVCGEYIIEASKCYDDFAVK